MSYFAKVENGIVTKVIVAENSFFNTFVDDSAGSWIETSTTGHIRKNYAGVGYPMLVMPLRLQLRRLKMWVLELQVQQQTFK